jgi:hypothetical protein
MHSLFGWIVEGGLPEMGRVGHSRMVGMVESPLLAPLVHPVVGVGVVGAAQQGRRLPVHRGGGHDLGRAHLLHLLEGLLLVRLLQVARVRPVVTRDLNK